MDRTAYTVGDPHLPYVEGCARGELVFSRCEACGKAQLAAHRICRHCGSTALRSEISSCHGSVASYTLVHRAASPHFKDLVPFTLALIDLDEGFRAMMRIAGNKQPKIGDRVAVGFVADGHDGAILPHARYVEETT